MKRPASIWLFDALFVSNMLLGVAFALPRLVLHSSLTHQNDPFFLIQALVTKVVAISLWFLVSVRRNENARITFAYGAFAMYALAAVGLALTAKNLGAFWIDWFAFVRIVLYLSAAALLWRADAKAWCSGVMPRL